MNTSSCMRSLLNRMRACYHLEQSNLRPDHPLHGKLRTHGASGADKRAHLDVTSPKESTFHAQYPEVFARLEKISTFYSHHPE